MPGRSLILDDEAEDKPYDFRRHSARLSRVIESEDDSEVNKSKSTTPNGKENSRSSNCSFSANVSRKKSLRVIDTSFVDEEVEEGLPHKKSRTGKKDYDERELASDGDDVVDGSGLSSTGLTTSESESEGSEGDATEDDELIMAQRSRRIRQNRVQGRYSLRRLPRGRMSESERLKSSLGSRIGEKNQMEEEDAALAAAIAAGYYSDDEHVNSKNNASSRDGNANYNPYARNGLGSFVGPTRRSGRTAAMVSAARVALYSTLLNPQSTEEDLANLNNFNHHHHHHNPSDPNGGRYNLRPNRPATSSNFGYLGVDDATLLLNGGGRHPSESIDSQRLYEEDDVDGNHQHSSVEGTVSLGSLDQIAGLDGYVKKLKEMVVFPLVYPQLFAKLNISLPRGVLFHGPPGTGKTLMARLLASACSTSTRKVSFFMRNGSDCLSKWIGEAERNMRLLFKKAKDCQPSIIFFDEIDGLAPERTGRQDQSHVSLVSTLLALMDGLDDRGQVVVIGATNRIHSIDGALRRPGRFDREFYFGLPDEAARTRILQIHTKTWDPPIEEGLAGDLASRSAGYSGADMKALCVEAALKAVQRTFPQIYDATDDSKVSSSSFSSINVQAGDFEAALLQMTPSTRRHISKFDLVSLQKPQSLLYDRQQRLFCEAILKPQLCRSFAQTANGQNAWQVKEPLMVRVAFAPRVHPESMVWRFMCGVADSLDGFTVEPVDLVIDLGRSETGSFEGALWRVLNEARSKAPICLLMKSFSALGREGRKATVSVLKMFSRILLPGEPVITLFPCKWSSKPQLEATGGPIRGFFLGAPDKDDLKEFFAFTLKSVYRLLSIEYEVASFSEEAFVEAGLLKCEKEFLRADAECNVASLEHWRLDWAHRVSGSGALEAIKTYLDLAEDSITLRVGEKASEVKIDLAREPGEQDLEPGTQDLPDQLPATIVLPENVLFE